MRIERIENPIKNIYYSMVMRDPCKKCIVRACCSKECKPKYIYRNVFGDGTRYTRILSWLAFIDVTIIFPWALFTIIFK